MLFFTFTNNVDVHTLIFPIAKDLIRVSDGGKSVLEYFIFLVMKEWMSEPNEYVKWAGPSINLLPVPNPTVGIKKLLDNGYKILWKGKNNI